MVLGGYSEVDWFQKQVEAQELLAKELGAQLDAASRHIASDAARIQELEERLYHASKRVLDVEQQLAQLPLMEHKLQLALHENGALWARVDTAEQALTAFQATQAYAMARRLQRVRRLVPGKG